ncbi:MAG: Histidine triad (HIT) protein [Parcubacteria group bacterium GW2011_GWB1_43_6]|nr:MAG: Histidine triad (HIT) protein [Parcubacteria group bacterium GW2011_GWB1_43_6]
MKIMNDCLFCKIVAKELPSAIIYENDNFLVIKDIKPLAPIHLLIITKKHISSVDHLAINDKELIGEMILTAQQVARDQGLRERGYKLSFNVGRGSGQLIPHLHLHLLGGWK